MSFLARSLFAGAAVSAMLIGGAATALADDAPPPPAPPNCTAADLAGVMSGVSAGTSVYLFTHSDVNAFFTGLKGQPRDQIREQAKSYMDANPQVRAELQGIRQPAADFRSRCG